MVLTERLLCGGGRLNAAEVLVHIGPTTGLLLLLCSLATEGPAILSQVRGTRGCLCVGGGCGLQCEGPGEEEGAAHCERPRGKRERAPA